MALRGRGKCLVGGGGGKNGSEHLHCCSTFREAHARGGAFLLSGHQRAVEILVDQAGDECLLRVALLNRLDLNPVVVFL